MDKPLDTGVLSELTEESSMDIKKWSWPWIVGAAFLMPAAASSQTLTGTLVGIVKDEQGGLLPGAVVRISSPALMGGVATRVTDERGQWRFPVLAPGTYALDIELAGFTSHHEEALDIGASATIERPIVLKLVGVAVAIVVAAGTSQLDARDPGFATRASPANLRGIPTRRNSMFDVIKAMPGISATSPSSSSVTTVSAFGSGTNENTFLVDGTSTTCPCNGVARSEPGIDFIQEVHVQSLGASPEFGNLQGAVFNVVTRQGSNRYVYDASYYGQTARLTSQPVLLNLPAPATGQTGFARIRYRDFTTSLGGPGIRDRLWFFAGYQYLRDYDAQPGTDRRFPRKYEQDKIFLKLNWRLSPNMQLMQSIHHESWFNPEPPTIVKSIEATQRRSASVPAMTFGHFTHIPSTTTVWDVRIGRFVHARKDESLDRTTPSRFDRVSGITIGAPAQVGDSTFTRTTAKATITHYRSGPWGFDHQWKMGAEVERGESYGTQIIPTGVRYVDTAGQPFQAISSPPSGSGGSFITAAAFVNDAITVADRLTITAGARFDHSRAISQDLHPLDTDGRNSSQVIEGLGTLYTWNTVSPRMGLALKLGGSGGTVLKSSYGRFSQGVLTGEFGFFHPAVTPVTTAAYDAATGKYSRLIKTVDPRTNLRLDSRIRAPNTSEFSVGLDREVNRRWFAGLTYVYKDGKDFIGWTDVGGRYIEEVRTLADGRRIPVWTLVNATSEQRFLLTNPEGYSLRYDGVVILIGARRSHGWQADASYTYSQTRGLQASSGATAAGAQVSTVAPPPAPAGVTFGRDPNDLTNTTGRLPNDRPHALRISGMADVPRTGVVVAANLQHFSGKPWAATTQMVLPQGDQRILLEPRGTRRLSSQSLLDLRMSRMVRFGPRVQAEFVLDVLNALNDAAEEGLASDDLFSTSFGIPSTFMDPRRVMFSVRLNLGT
jgi:hypothetical protein